LGPPSPLHIDLGKPIVPDKGIDATRHHWSSERIEAVMKKLTDRKHLSNPDMLRLFLFVSSQSCQQE